MGYRSDITLVFYSRGAGAIPYPALKLWVDENFPIKEATTEWEAKLETDEATYIMLTYQDVKWYSGYTHVEAVRQSLIRFSETFDEAGAEEAVAAFEMVILGEETEDIQEQRSDWSDCRLGVKREVYFD
jgi:hypothetical protein